MPGAGTKTATTIAEPAARLLDLTRLLTRVGRGPKTGVDRVEFAYLQRLLHESVPLYGLIQTRYGCFLLGQSGCQGFCDRIADTKAWGTENLANRLRRKLPKQRRQAESDLRRLALDLCPARGLAAMLTRHLPAGTHYLNVGHSNLDEASMTAVRALPGVRIAVLIHDTIPLDFPQYQRPGTPAQFAEKFKIVAKHADLILCNSNQTRQDVLRHLPDQGAIPKTLVAFLGVELAAPDRRELLADLDLSGPYFVTLGTIEPRKNHKLLLDVWDGLAAKLDNTKMPRLIIVGARGWNNAAVFDRLDHLPRGAGPVHEINDLPDGAMMALMQGAAGFLFPSLAEGFGLPPIEAMALGVPVLCGDLPVYRETMGNKPIYLPLNDVYQWSEHIMVLANRQNPDGESRVGATGELPSWESHFNLVLKCI